jgi:ankyrin repeat protein
MIIDCFFSVEMKCVDWIEAQWGHIEAVKLLCERGAIHTLKDKDGATPFFRACKWGHYQVVKYFLETQCADPNEIDSQGNTALHFAARFGQLEVVTLLVKTFHVDANKRNHEGRYE